MDSTTKLLDAAPPPLSAAEEQTLLRAAHAGDTEARHKLAMSIAPWAMARCKYYFGKGMVRDDFFQVAMMGVLRAIDLYRFDGNRLVTYATWRILHELNMALRDGDLIRSPEHMRKFPRKIGPLGHAVAAKPEPEEHDLWFLKKITLRERVIIRLYFWEGLNYQQIAEPFGITKQRVQQIMASIQKRVLVLDERRERKLRAIA